MIIPLNELKELTECRQKAPMIRWLADRNWKFEVGANGWPKVAKAEFEAKMLSGGGVRRKKRPNLEAIR